MQHFLALFCRRRSFFAVFAVVVWCGCNDEQSASKGNAEEQLAQVKAVQTSSIVLKTETPDTLCTVQGAVRDNGKGGVVWKTPGKGRFSVEIPWHPAAVEHDLWARLILKNDKGQPFSIGDAKVGLTTRDQDKLKMLVELDVLGRFQTHGDILLRIYYDDENGPHTVADIPFHGRFE